MSKYYTISPAKLTLKDINDIIFNNKKIKLSNDSVSNIKKSKAYLNTKLAESDKPFYGINTGFGSLYNVKISKRDLTKLQENLVDGVFDGDKTRALGNVYDSSLKAGSQKVAGHFGSGSLDYSTPVTIGLSLNFFNGTLKQGMFS